MAADLPKQTFWQAVLELEAPFVSSMLSMKYELARKDIVASLELLLVRFHSVYEIVA